VRVSFNYFTSDEVFRYIVNAVSMVADHGYKLVPHYRFALETGLWRHENGPVEPPLRLAQLSYDADGVLTFPRHRETAPESALAGYLADAAALFASLPEPGVDHIADAVSADFEHLRWFDLPAASLGLNPTAEPESLPAR
jgi:hypothetical protein